MRARTLIFILLASFAPNIFGQALTYTPPASAAYLLSGGAWSAWSAALGADPLPYVPPAVGLYCSADGTTWTPCTGGGGGGSFTALTGDATSTSTGGATEVVGLLNHLLPSLTTGYLNYTGSAWALSPISVTFDQIGSGTNLGHGLVCGTGCVFTTAGTGVNNANEIGGVLLSGLATGLLKNTTATGVPSIATAGTDYLTPTGSGTGLSGVGLTGSPLSQFASTTSAQLAGVLSDETGTGVAVFANTPTLVTPNIGAATGTSLLVTGNLDGTAPVTITTGTTASLGGTFRSGYTYNQEATAATAVAYTLPTAAAGRQYCVGNSYNGTAANTGVLTVSTSASGQFVIFTDGTLSATGGNVTSGGAGGDAACFVGVDATHWQMYLQMGVWSKH